MAIPTLISYENSDWGVVVFPFNKKEWVLPYCLSSREVFTLDPVWLVRFKCLILTPATPLVTVIRIVYELAKATFSALRAVYYSLDNQPSSQGCFSYLKTGVYESGRTLLYGVSLTAFAAMGIFDPYRGRQKYGWLERELNRQPDGPHRGKFYLAFCFQRIAILPVDFPNNSDFAINKIKKRIAPLDAIVTAIRAGSLSELKDASKLVFPL